MNWPNSLLSIIYHQTTSNILSNLNQFFKKHMHTTTIKGWFIFPNFFKFILNLDILGYFSALSIISNTELLDARGAVANTVKNPLNLHVDNMSAFSTL